MEREYKPVQLRPVDDDAAKPAPVIRLKNRETVRLEKEVKPIRLGQHAETPDVSQRLDLPTREEVDLRTHQPGIDAIIETEAIIQEPLEENWGEISNLRNPIPWGWFVLIGLAISGAVLWSLSRVEKADVQADQIRTTTESVLIQDQQDEQEARELIARIHQTLLDFFNASSVESLALQIRHPERVTPLMRRYYADQAICAIPVQTVTSLSPLTLDDYANFWMASVELTDGSQLDIIIEILESGAARVDWETFVRYQPMKWDDYVAQRPAATPMDFRVFVVPDNYYNYEFGDAKRWTCFRLTTLDSDATLYGYAPAGSAIAQALLRQIKLNGGRQTAMILRLSVPKGLPSPRGVVIEKLLSNRWLYVEPPDAGS
jgi:hypothetical protein